MLRSIQLYQIRAQKPHKDIHLFISGWRPGTWFAIWQRKHFANEEIPAECIQCRSRNRMWPWLASGNEYASFGYVLKHISRNHVVDTFVHGSLQQSTKTTAKSLYNRELEEINRGLCSMCPETNVLFSFLLILAFSFAFALAFLFISKTHLLPGGGATCTRATRRTR